MKRWVRILLFVLLLLVIAGGVGWLMIRPRDPMFHGQRESVWIKSIEYPASDAQTQQWREFGPAGVEVLARALDSGRTYRKFYTRWLPRLPGFLRRPLSRRLPEPGESRPMRMCVLSLLRNLGKDAGLAEPAVARAMEENDTRVRVSALSCYELGMLEGIGEKQKAARLPAFVRATRDSEWAVRNNAVVALQFYTNQAKIVTPVLLGTLKDSDFHVRMTSAEALARVDVQAGIQAGILQIFLSMLNDPNARATRALGDLGTNAAPAVPALIEAAKSTNRFVAQNALYTLKKIDPAAAVKATAK